MMIVQKKGFIGEAPAGSTAMIMIHCTASHLPETAARPLDDYQVPPLPAASR